VRIVSALSHARRADHRLESASLRNAGITSPLSWSRLHSLLVLFVFTIFLLVFDYLYFIILLFIILLYYMLFFFYIF